MELNKLRDELDKWEAVRYRMEAEGMDYCFRSYSSFEEIEDEEFHLKREKLISLMVEMVRYVEQMITEVEDKIIEINNEDNY